MEYDDSQCEIVENQIAMPEIHDPYSFEEFKWCKLPNL